MPDDVASQLESLWREHVTRVPRVRAGSRFHAEEVADPERYWDGAVLTVTVNRFEREARARAACIDHHGPTCQVCDLDFAERYGQIGEAFIHVHHVEPLAAGRWPPSAAATRWTR